MEQELNKIWIGPNKIQANIARFSRRNRVHIIQESNRKTAVNTNRLKPSYADIVSRRPCSPNQQVRAVKGNSTNILDSFNLELKIDDEIFRISVAEEIPCHGGCFNNWWLERDFQPSASLSVNPPTSFVAESKQCERNRNSGGEATITPVMAMARKPNPHKICPRDVVNAAGINEELRNSSVSERVSDIVRGAILDLAHEVGGGEGIGCRQSNGRDIDCTRVCNHGSNKMGLGLVNKGDDNTGILLYSEDNHNKEKSTGLIGPQT
ncbi:hypothetical protein Ancab_023761 [Ancistrocladus abbreviatus]